MNYLCHGRDHLGEPYALAGTALPDWLRMIHRRLRFNSSRLPRIEPDDASPEAQLAKGVGAHYIDDRWFHASEAFAAVSGEVTEQIRATYPEAVGDPRPRHIRASFYGHILPELLLDAWLMERRPTFVDRYYEALDQLDAARVVRFATAHLGRTPEHLDRLIVRFRRYPFLRTYLDDGEICQRLDEVTRRIGLPPLPGDFRATVRWTRDLVGRHGDALLTRPAV